MTDAAGCRSSSQNEASLHGARWAAAEDCTLLVGLKLAVGAYVLVAGFTHVSDDDYARTLIAETFAHAPRFDPSGTSWLPLPFWVVGAAMVAAERSLRVARGVAVAMGAASVIAPYAAMRVAGVTRWVAVGATCIGMATPWNAWLGVATVPEGWADALVAGAAIAMANDRARPWAAGALFAASLSRYEAWPACSLFGAFCVAQSYAGRARGHGVWGRELACAVFAAAGPCLWMAWNAYAHGSAFHFVARVSAFRRAIGAADRPLRDKLFGYPRGLAVEMPEAVALGCLGVCAYAMHAPFRAKWRWGGASAIAILVFLVVGDVRDGAPTHHPERALTAIAWVLGCMGVDAVGLAFTWARRRAARGATVALAAAATAWAASLPARWSLAPGNLQGERRDAQITRGLSMRARGVASAEITPCAFEHFALLAAWGEPERARIRSPTRMPPTADCPLVTEP